MISQDFFEKENIIQITRILTHHGIKIFVSSPFIFFLLLSLGQRIEIEKWLREWNVQCNFLAVYLSFSPIFYKFNKAHGDTNKIKEVNLFTRHIFGRLSVYLNHAVKSLAKLFLQFYNKFIIIFKFILTTEISRLQQRVIINEEI